MDPSSATVPTVGADEGITNVFVLMLENHSFDHLFAMSGIPGIRAATVSEQNSYTPPGTMASTTCSVRDGAPWRMSTDPGHEFPDVLRQLCNVAPCDGDADDDNDDEHDACYPGGAYPAVDLSGFAANYATSSSEGTGIPAADRVCDVMACFHTATQLPVILQLARVRDLRCLVLLDAGPDVAESLLRARCLVVGHGSKPDTGRGDRMGNHRRLHVRQRLHLRALSHAGHGTGSTKTRTTSSVTSRRTCGREGGSLRSRL